MTCRSHILMYTEVSMQDLKSCVELCSEMKGGLCSVLESFVHVPRSLMS